VPADQTEGYAESAGLCGAFDWSYDLLESCGPWCGQSIGDRQYAWAGYGVDLTVGVQNRRGAAAQAGGSTCLGDPECRQDAAWASANAAIDAAVFGYSFTILGLSARAEANGGSSGIGCDCGDPAIAAPRPAGAAVTGALTVAGFTVQQARDVPGPLFSWFRSQQVVRARRTFTVGPVPFTAGAEVFLDLGFTMDVTPRFSIPDSIGATLQPTPVVTLRAVAEGGIGTDVGGVFVGLDINLVRLTFDNALTTDLTMAVCRDAVDPFATVTGSGELVVQPFGGSFYAEARLDLGFYSESYRETFFRWNPVWVAPLRLYSFDATLNP
jgi:hypothetical protein